ncbi:unnamed protein product, partial [Ectocarpus sp. 8 AP-2014]
LLWREGAGPLVDSGTSLDSRGQLDTEQMQPISSPTARAAAAAASAAGGGGSKGSFTSTASSPTRRAGDFASPLSPPPPPPPPPPPDEDDPATAAGDATATSTAAGWTSARKGIDSELALLYLLDVSAFHGLVVRHKQHLGQAGGPSSFGSRRMKSVGALQGLGSFVSRKVSGSRGSGRHQDGGVDSDVGDGGGGGGGSRRRASSSSGGFGELPAGKMAELRRQREAAGAASNMMGGSFGSGSAHSVPSPADSWDSAGHWDEKKQYQIQLGEEAGDGIPAAIDGKARKILGLPPHRRASVGASASAGSSPVPGAHGGGAGRPGGAAGGAGRPGRAAGGAGMPPPPPPSRSGPLPRRTPVRPVQKSPSPLVQNQQHHFPGDGSAAAGRGPPPQPGTGGAAAAAAGGAGGYDAVLSTPETGTSMAPFAEGGVYSVMSTSSSGSEDGGGGGGDGSSGSRRRKRGSGDGGGESCGGGDGGGKAFRSSKSSSSGGGSRHLPPRDGTSRAAARAARMEADKLAALRHFVSEAKLETKSSRSGGGGGAAAVDAAAEAATRGRGRARSGSGGAQLVVWNDTEEEDARAEMARIDPPLLPSGELLPEDSKAWKVLGAGGGGGGSVRSFSGSSLPSALVATSRSEEFDVGSLRSKLAGRGDNKLSPSPSPPLHPRLTMEGYGRTADGRPLSLSLASFDIGAGTASKVAKQWAACNSVVPTPHGGTTRRADPPLSPGVQTPPPLSPPGISDLGSVVVGNDSNKALTLTMSGGGGDGVEHDGRHQQKNTLRSPVSARGGPRSHWANTTAAEAEAAATAVSPPSWGARKGFLSSAHSPASTPRAGGSSNNTGGGGGGGGGGGSVATRTPGRLPRRLHQGVNKVKRAVGVGEYNPGSGQVMPAGGSAAGPRTPRGGGGSDGGFDTGAAASMHAPSPRRGFRRTGSASGADGDSSSNCGGGGTGGGNNGRPPARSPRVNVTPSFSSSGEGDPPQRQTATLLPPRSGVGSGGGSRQQQSTAASASAAAANAAMVAMKMMDSPMGGGGAAGGGSGGSGGSGGGGDAGAGGAMSLQQKKHKLDRLVKLLGPEFREEIWESMSSQQVAGGAPTTGDGDGDDTGGGGGGSLLGTLTQSTPAASSSLSGWTVGGGGTRGAGDVSLDGSVRSVHGTGSGPLGAKAGCSNRRWSMEHGLGGGGGMCNGGGSGVHYEPGAGLGSGSGRGGGCGGTFGNSGGLAAGGGGSVVKGGKMTKFPYQKRLREGLDAAYQNRGMLFCLQEALLYVRGKDPICPGYSPRWWPSSPATSPQIRAPLVGSWFEGRRVGAASLLPWQMRHNLFGEGALADGGGAGAGSPSRVRADGTRVPPMMVLPLSAVQKRLPDFDEGLTVPVSEIPRNAVVVWVSHYWGGTPARPDDQGNTKAKAIYEGLAVRER